VNPFDLPGPAFLLFYAGFGVAIVLIARKLIHRREAHLEIPRLNLTDPYQIAMLRGDENEAMRVAAISLVDRDLLKVSGDTLTAKEGAEAHVRRPIEKAMLAHFRTTKIAHQMYSSMRLKESCDDYRKTLWDLNLLAGPNTHPHRFQIIATALAVALGTSWIKISMAIDRERPFGFLVMLTLILVFVLLAMGRKRRTVLGDRIMRDLKDLFRQLKTRAHLLRRGGDTNEVALLVAIFGISALSSEHDYAQLLFPKAAKNDNSCGGSSCSSSCGSSCGGGGGGCGGCGGD
jgi:uncharacterized protein (TIGR04222 family)